MNVDMETAKKLQKELLQLEEKYTNSCREYWAVYDSIRDVKKELLSNGNDDFAGLWELEKEEKALRESTNQLFDKIYNIRNKLGK